MTTNNIDKTLPTQSLQDVICLFDDDFSIDWIIDLTEKKPSQVLIELESGVKQGWLKQSATGRYLFTSQKKKDQLQFNVSLPKKEVLYRKIAELFLKEIPNNEQDAGKLAKYLLNITNNETGCRGLLLAGDAFVRNFNPEKALECYSKLKFDLLKLNSEEADDIFIDMAIKHSKISTASQNTTEVIDTLKDAMSRAIKRGSLANHALIQMHIAKNEWLLNRYSSALDFFQKGWDIAIQCNDPKLLLSATTFSTFFSYWQGRFKEMLSQYENAISDVEKHPSGGFPLLATITVGQCYIHVGQTTQGLGMLDAILVSCREVGDKYTAAFAISTITSALLCIRPLKETIQYIEQTYDEIYQSRNQYIELLTDGSLAYLHYLEGNITRSILFLKKFVKKCRDVNIATLHHLPYLLEICWAMAQGKYPQMLDLSLEKEVNNLIAGQNVYLKGLAFRYKALLKIQAGQSSGSIMKSLELSLKWLEESGHELEIAKTRMEILREYLKQGDQENVQKIIEQVSEVLPQYNDEIIPTDLSPLIKGASSPQKLLKEILKLGPEISNARDNKELVQKIISTVNRLTGAERGAIFLLNNDSNSTELRLRASKNLSHEQVSHPRFKSSMRFIEEVARSGLIQKSDILEQQDRDESFNSFCGDIVRSCICVPIIFKEKVIGVLYHDNRLLNSAFKESDFELLSFFAAQAAIALDNANAYEKITYLDRKLQDEKIDTHELPDQKERFKDIVGKSDAIRNMLTLVEQVAATDTTVLIEGETGVGKELVANAINYHSSRRGKPFIKANCSALTETIINSELFGHEKGAFTGANNRRIGRFEQANGGTIFLDEIGDLPLNVQVNLLRVIQNNEFERVGGNETISSNFRLIVATNHDLEELVKQNRFRADLYFRLNVFPINVPPLRERKEDIPLLTHHFIGLFGQKIDKHIKKISLDEMNKLIQYHWPGNIRELENIIERGIILSSASFFKTPELGTHIKPLDNKRQNHTLAENEHSHILWALEQKGWKVRGPGGVAEFLNIHPSTLAARMKKLGISRAPKGSKKNMGIPSSL